MEKNTKKIYRDAITGKIVTKEYALANPKTTVADTMPVNSSGKPPKPYDQPDTGGFGEENNEFLAETEEQRILREEDAHFVGEE